jgi:hypothetical protein
MKQHKESIILNRAGRRNEVMNIFRIMILFLSWIANSISFQFIDIQQIIEVLVNIQRSIIL